MHKHCWWRYNKGVGFNCFHFGRCHISAAAVFDVTDTRWVALWFQEATASISLLLTCYRTFVFGLERFALLNPADCDDLKVVFFGRVVVLDEQLRFLLRDRNLRLLATCSGREEETAWWWDDGREAGTAECCVKWKANPVVPSHQREAKHLYCWYLQDWATLTKNDDGHGPRKRRSMYF